jgi:hypothetical protein
MHQHPFFPLVRLLYHLPLSQHSLLPLVHPFRYLPLVKYDLRNLRFEGKSLRGRRGAPSRKSTTMARLVTQKSLSSACTSLSRPRSRPLDLRSTHLERVSVRGKPVASARTSTLMMRFAVRRPFAWSKALQLRHN